MNPLIHTEDRPLQSPIIVALDVNQAEKALAFAAIHLDPQLCRVKVGKELFTASGRSLVECLIARGFQVFLDLKYHDIPHTVAQACRAAADMGVWMVNVHALGGRRMMEATSEALSHYSNRPILIAVTLLTSMEPVDLQDLGLPGTLQENVLRLARLTQQSGLDGVVCSAQEAALLKAEMGQAFTLVTPGIRLAPESMDSIDDQRRIMTPQAALAAGSDYLVIGRPITQAKSPLAVLQHIYQEIA